jgi:hypothetical protein
MCKNYFCKLFGIAFILPFLLFLFTSFSCYCGVVLQILETLRFIFLKGIVELEDMKHGGLAPRINDVALSNVATRRFAESGNPVASSVLGFS